MKTRDGNKGSAPEGSGAKLLVIDDHPIVREGLAAVLRSAGMAVLQAPGAEEALALVAAHPDIVAATLDLAMPGLSGLAAVDALLAATPALAVIVISAREGEDDVRRALARGVRGYIPKSSRPQTLLAAVSLVLSGEVYVPPLLLGQDEAPSPSPGSPARLTPRQVEVLDAVCAGQSNKQIAIGLGLSDKTVKAHVSAIFRSLGVVNRTQAAAAAKRASLLN